jgi:hypothetical protein
MHNFLSIERNFVKRQSILLLAAIFILSLLSSIYPQVPGVVSVIGEV